MVLHKHSGNVMGLGVDFDLINSDRLKRQNEFFLEFYRTAYSLGVSDECFAHGAFFNPLLRGSRYHKDVDVVIRGKENFFLLYDELTNRSNASFENCTPPAIKGSSLYYLRPVQKGCGVLELRYVTSEVRNELVVWKHEIPLWVKPFLSGRPLIIPDSVFEFTEPWDVCGIKMKHLKNEYTYLTKSHSARDKEIMDLEKLKEAIDMNTVSAIQAEVEKSGATLCLPNELMHLVDIDGLND